jgi:hypothetical protein
MTITHKKSELVKKIEDLFQKFSMVTPAELQEEVLVIAKEVVVSLEYLTIIEDFFVDINEAFKQYETLNSSPRTTFATIKEVDNYFRMFNTYLTKLNDAGKIIANKEVLDNIYDQLCKSITVLSYRKAEVKKMKLSSDEVLHREFDVNTHKEYFTNYLEVIIHPDGLVEYAIPSHQVKLFMIYYEQKFNKKIQYYSEEFFTIRTDVESSVPREFWLDMVQYYCNVTGCISMWDKSYVAPESGLTEAQKTVIETLKRNKLYRGE